MNQYEQVPDMISGKDLDYLSDMFEWNYGALKKVNASINNVQNQEIKEILQKGYTLFNNNLNSIFQILEQGGQNEQQSN